MARTVGKLSAAAVKNATRRGYYSDGGGLYLQVGAGGSKSWVFRYKAAGKLHEMGLGALHTVGLAEARTKARQNRGHRLDGLDPLAVKSATRLQAKLDAAKTMTFAACAEGYINAHRAAWRNEKHRDQWPNTLATYVNPVFGGLPVQAIDTALVMKAIEPVWNEKPETASRVRGRIEAILDWATARGYRAGENPARWRGHLDKLLPKPSKAKAAARRENGRGEHHAALPYREIGAFMVELRQQQGVGARALEFAILTAARTGEVIGAPWDEINMAERLWAVPADRMKGGREHRVPLSDAALAILKEMAKVREGNFVFPGGRAGQPLSNMAMLMAQRRMGRGDLTAHGFRSSFRDWAAERTGFPAEVAEMALAHTVGDKVEAAYRRGDLFQKRRQIMDAWAKFCATAPAAGGKVVQFAAAK
jgi:integrase